MSQIEQLARGFERARVPLEVANRPFVRSVASDEIVQMDVRRFQERGRVRETILLWPGKGAELLVTGTDAELAQLVLRVREPRRKFVERIWDSKERKVREVERWTNPELRRFLVGMDESHLFVAQLTTNATSVAQAHRGLRPKELEERPEKYRQGEWFFVPITAAEHALIRKVSGRFFRRNEAIGGNGARRGRPHYAEQLVRVRDETGPRFVEFVRGRVRHPDHATLELKEWMRVFLNTENRSVGATWVD